MTEVNYVSSLRRGKMNGCIMCRRILIDVRASCLYLSTINNTEGRNCRWPVSSICFAPFHKNSCALLRRGAHTSRKKPHRTRKMKPEIIGLVPTATRQFLESEKGERKSRRTHRAQENPRRLRRAIVMMRRRRFGWWWWTWYNMPGGITIITTPSNNFSILTLMHCSHGYSIRVRFPLKLRGHFLRSLIFVKCIYPKKEDVSL